MSRNKFAILLYTLDEEDLSVETGTFCEGKKRVFTWSRNNNIFVKHWGFILSPLTMKPEVVRVGGFLVINAICQPLFVMVWFIDFKLPVQLHHGVHIKFKLIYFLFRGIYLIVFKYIFLFTIRLELHSSSPINKDE